MYKIRRKLGREIDISKEVREEKEGDGVERDRERKLGRDGQWLHLSRVGHLLIQKINMTGKGSQWHVHANH